MKQRSFLLLITALILIMLAVTGFFLFNTKPIKGNGFTKMTIYLNGDKKGPYIIKEKKIINNTIKKINSGPKKDISRISFEKGPDGKIIFEGENSVHEVKVFSDGGNIVTDQYYILTAFNLDKIIVQE